MAVDTLKAELDCTTSALLSPDEADALADQLRAAAKDVRNV